jgi:response regulator RpfG family c-di-GMP phosphodiesterase
MPESSTDTSQYSEMTILCVDDERVILRTLQRLFHRKAYKVLIADSAKNALSILEQTPVDVIVSDMRMPEMDGAALLEKVANAYPSTYRIVLSGYADFASTVAAINLGKINRFINKPWNNGELVNAIEDGLEKIQLKKENNNLKIKIEKQNILLKSLNHDLEEKVNLRTKQIRASLLRNERNNKACEKMLFNFIAIDPYLSGVFAKKVGQLAGQLGEQLGLDKEAIRDVRLAGFLNEIGMLGLDPILCSTPYNLLNFEQKKLFMTQGLIAQQILSPAQRLNSVKAVLTHQFSTLENIAESADSKTLQACKIINVARDYWRFAFGKIEEKKMEHKQIFVELNKSRGIKYAESILDILIAKPELIEDNIIEKGLTAKQLLPEMILKHSLFSNHNLLILAEGHEFTEHSIDKLIEYEINQKHQFVIVIEQ